MAGGRGGAEKCVVGSISREFLKYTHIYTICAKNVFRKETGQGGDFPFLLSIFL